MQGTCNWKDCSEDRAGNSKYCWHHRAEARKNWKNSIEKKSQDRKQRYANFDRVWNKACRLAREESDKCVPTPMTVVENQDPLDDNSPLKKAWFVRSGVCGYAWLVVRPGNSSFAKWMRKNKDSRQAYHGGEHWSCPLRIQSMEIQIAYIHEFVRVLESELKDIKVYSMNRMD